MRTGCLSPPRASPRGKHRRPRRRIASPRPQVVPSPSPPLAARRARLRLRAAANTRRRKARRRRRRRLTCRVLTLPSTTTESVTVGRGRVRRRRVLMEVERPSPRGPAGAARRPPRAPPRRLRATTFRVLPRRLQRGSPWVAWLLPRRLRCFLPRCPRPPPPRRLRRASPRAGPPGCRPRRAGSGWIRASRVETFESVSGSYLLVVESKRLRFDGDDDEGRKGCMRRLLGMHVRSRRFCEYGGYDGMETSWRVLGDRKIAFDERAHWITESEYHVPE
jgi:hypothetical protein